MKRYNVILTLLMLVLYIVAALVFNGEYKHYSFPFLPAIPVYFVLIGGITIGLLKAIKGNGVNLILGVKVAKLLLSLLLVFAYVLLVKTNAVAFVITFTAFFLAYLIFETYILLDWNKRNKKTNEIK